MADRSQRVLIVEDYAPLREQLALLLRRAHYQVFEADDVTVAWAVAANESLDAIILDVGLPSGDGVGLCQRLRHEGLAQIPVLMLTARDTISDRVRGLDAGADDYLVKPFANDELLARMRALLRRRGIGESFSICVGDLEVDRRSREARRQGLRLTLPPTAFQILLLLAEAYPRALTRSEIVRKIWNDVPPESDPLRTHIHQLRLALDSEFQHPMLRTVHGVGFRLELE